MPNKPVWSEGVLVSQHHFQQQDRYHEALLRDRLRAITHYDWGVSEMEVDERGFAAGEFRLRRLSAIWPDGTSVVCGDGGDLPPRAQGRSVRLEPGVRRRALRRRYLLRRGLHHRLPAL